MARNSLGSLIVTLGLDAAQYVAGLTKAEFEAKKFQASLEKGVATAGRAAAAGMTLLAGAAVATGVAIDKLAKNAATFKDLEEKTGASAEGMASMAVAAAVAGTEMGTVAAASVKLTKGLVEVDDESKAAGAALGALGLNVKQFKALDPAAQMEAVAKALARFADGASKTAVAVALFGKAGADMLPFLKELAGESGRQVILTQRQIEAADAYADAQARLTAQVKLYAESLAADVVPHMLDFINKLVESKRETNSLWESLKVFNQLSLFGSSEDDVTRLTKQIAELDKSIARIKARGPLTIFGMEMGAGRTANLEADRATQLKALEAAKRGVLNELNARDSGVDRGFDSGTKPRLRFAGAPDKAKKAARDQRAEADRYIDSLDKQIERTRDLTVEQQALQDIQAGRIKNITPLQIVMVLAMAREVDAALALKKATEDATKAEQERAQARAQLFEQSTRELDALRQTNQQIEDEIALLGKDEAAHTRLAQARIDDEIALKRWLISLNSANELGQEYVDGLNEQIVVLERRKTLLGVRDVGRQLEEEAQKAKQFYADLGGTIAGAFEEAIINGNNLRDVIKGLEQDLVRILTRKLATEPLANMLTKQLQGFDFLKLFGMGGGGGGVPGVGFSGGGFGEHFASGGVSSGGWAMVGERGPEIVNLPKGAQVIPNSALQQKRGERASINVYQSFAPGTDRSTIGQAAAAAGKAVRRGLERYA